MFGKIAAFEFRYQLRQPVFWVGVILFGLFAFGVTTVSQISIGLGPNDDRNSPFALALAHLTFGLFYFFILTAFVANVVVRDDETGFGPILRSTRINRFDYLLGRFSGAFAAAALSFLIVPLGVLIGSFAPWVDSELLGPNQLNGYLFAYFVLALPTLFMAAALFFGLATVTRSMMWTYVGTIVFLVIYLTASIALDKPGLEKSVALFDPIGMSAYGLVTKYWTNAERNTLIPSVEGVLLWNRLFVIGLGVVFLAGACVLFRFQSGAQSGRKAKRDRLAAAAAPDAPPPPLAARPKPVFNRATAWRQLLARTRLDMVQVFGSPAYAVLLAVGLANAMGGLWFATQDTGYGGVIFPVTRVLIPTLVGSFGLIPFIIAVYYAGELVWREREKKTHEIVDSTPVPDWAYVLPKVTAISLVLISTLVVSALGAIGLQLGKGFTDVQLGHYLVWYLLPQAVDFILLAVLAVFLQVLSPHKFVGWGLMVIYMITTITFNNLGFEHNLYNYAGSPGVPLSDMNGMGKFWIGAWWFRLYWAAFAVVLVVLSYALWRRGTETRLRPRLRRLPRRLTGKAGLVMAAAALLFVGAGGFIYYNTDVLNEYRTGPDNDKWQADYEKALLRYEHTPRPKIVSMKLDVDLYPHEPRATVLGSYVVENRTNERLKEIHVAFDRDLKVKALSIQGGRPKRTYERFNYRIFQLDTPMLPGERREITFTTERSQRGFRNSGNETRVVDNGTFLNNAEFAPSLGIDRGGMLQDRVKRRKYGLPSELRPPKLGDVPSRQFHYLRHDADFVSADITVSTVADQIPVAPGKVVSDITQNGRRKVRFVTEAPVMPFFSVQSARYAIAHERYKGVEIAVYYDPQHPWNVERMKRAAKASLDYYQANFSPYQFSQLRFLEFPAYADFAQAFAGTMPWSENLFFIADYSDPSKIDMVTYVGAHEIGHQWWAHQVIGADQQGMTVLSETLAQYSALMVMKHMYGEDQIRKFLKFELDRYLRARGGEAIEELPLARVENQGYIHYRKGSVVMYRLQREIGEEAVNRALRRILADHAFKGAPYPISTDLIAAFRAEAPADKQALITDLFEKITLYDIKTEKVAVRKRKDGRFDVALTVKARKLYADGKGKETEAPLAETLDVGLFTAMPGEKGFDSSKVVLLDKRPIRSGTQTLTFVTAKAPTYAGVDPYNYLIDRDADDNVAKAD
ncbi:ABC transporter permease/M1 family aminopeptidase [Caulobacter mirabilis]|uniref:Aminopeptidase n=1 Tax=Caulobacter mirabilis TaxID=69666 RepID=A0A2D2ASG9_9CAUL|nr:M1 family aminopeptidase [Caulobacter mirabilis]ATQ40949.1 aminopeptidase [Caulobacter mirabilis]